VRITSSIPANKEVIEAFLVIAIGLLVSAAAIWIVKVPKSISAQVPTH